MLRTRVLHAEPLPEGPVEVSMRSWLVVLLLPACSGKPTEPQPTAACADLSQFELSGCDASSLAQLQHEGAWNLQLRFPDGRTSAASFSLIAGGENVFGRPLEGKNLRGRRHGRGRLHLRRRKRPRSPHLRGTRGALKRPAEAFPPRHREEDRWVVTVQAERVGRNRN